MRHLFIIVLSICMLSCTPEGKLRRFLKKHPQLVKVDTVQVLDTTVVQGVRKDSVFSIQHIISSKDTLIINKERLTVKMIYKNDSVYLSGECETDTVFRLRNKYIYQVKSIEKPFKFKTIYYLWIVLLILLLYVISKFKRKQS